jgi:hypothetical protein
MNLCSEVTSVLYPKEKLENEEINIQGVENEQN